ncbi:MAG: OsmC family protein [Oligoflexia bacterium]|nr:OsmC family protein [Oligoflexia bacterium]
MSTTPRIAQVSRVSRFRQQIRIGGHQLVADEPEELGGADAGPTAEELLAAALGTCTAITLEMYAERKGWPLQDAQVSVQLEKTPERALFHREVRLLGEFSGEQRARLLEIANRCPVHRILTGEIAIDTRLVE